MRKVFTYGEIVRVQIPKGLNFLGMVYGESKLPGRERIIYVMPENDPCCCGFLIRNVHKITPIRGDKKCTIWKQLKLKR